MSITAMLKVSLESPPEAIRDFYDPRFHRLHRRGTLKLGGFFNDHSIFHVENVLQFATSDVRKLGTGQLEDLLPVKAAEVLPPLVVFLRSERNFPLARWIMVAVIRNYATVLTTRGSRSELPKAYVNQVSGFATKLTAAFEASGELSGAKFSSVLLLPHMLLGDVHTYARHRPAIRIAYQIFEAFRETD